MRTFAKHPTTTPRPTSTRSEIPDPARVWPGGVGVDDTIQQLQRTIGNQAVHRLLEATREDTERGVQRYAFVNETQVTKSEKSLTKDMKKLVSDKVIRNYTGLDEFKKHTEQQTDYLGNLADGTWMRFSPTGINLLGENHTKVSLEHVLPGWGARTSSTNPSPPMR